MASRPATLAPLSPAAIFVLATWFALLAGVLEGLVKWGLPVLGWAGSTRFCLGDLKELWAPVAVDIVFFLGVGIAVLACSRLVPRLPWLVIACGLFAALLFYSMLSVTGRLGGRGALMLGIGLGVLVARRFKSDPAGGVARLRRSLIPLTMIAVILCAGPWAAVALRERVAAGRLPPPREGTPNILLIVMDTARADRLGAYGYSRPTTPFLDEFARRAVLFENAMANSAWTLPSHVSLLTGRLPHQHQAEERGSHYDGRFPTITQALAARGYATVAVAANHGFASCAVGVTTDFLHCEDAPALIEQISSPFYFTQLKVPAILRRLGFVDLGREWISAAEVNSGLLRWLDERPDRPFFAFLNYNDLHFPFQPPLEFRRQFSDDMVTLRLQEWARMRESPEHMEAALVRRASDHYDASLAYLDFQLRVLFSELERRDLTKNLVVVITSDHGESLGEHNLLEHQIGLYRQMIQVPLLVRWPGHTPAGLRVAQPVGLHQFPATVSALLGISPGQFAGPGFEAFWQDPSTKGEDVISDLAGGRWAGVPSHWPIYHGRLRSLVSEHWHLLLRGDGVAELYDWKADPREERNLASDPAHQEVVEALRERLRAATKQP